MTRPYVFHGGTYNGTPARWRRAWRRSTSSRSPARWRARRAGGTSSAHGLPDIARRRASPLQVLGRGSIVDFYFTESPIRSSREVWASNLRRRRALDYDLLAGGIYNAPRAPLPPVAGAHAGRRRPRTLALIDGSLTGMTTDGEDDAAGEVLHRSRRCSRASRSASSATCGWRRPRARTSPRRATTCCATSPARACIVTRDETAAASGRSTTSAGIVALGSAPTPKGQFAGRIQCPYHAWTYGLDGQLVAAPHMDGTPGFRMQRHPLGAGRASRRGAAHVFVDAEPVARAAARTQIGALAEKFARGTWAGCGAPTA